MPISTEDFLKAIEVDPSELTKDDVKIEDVVTSFHDKQKQHWFSIFENSDELKQKQTELEKQFYGKHSKMLDSAIKKAGLVLTDEQSKMRPVEKIELLAQHLVTSSAGTKEIGELQGQLLEWKNKYNDLEKTAEQKIQDAMSAADKKVLSDKINFHLKNKFISVPKERLVGNEHLDIHWIGLDAKLREKYDISFDESGQFVFYKKGTSQKVEGKKDGRDVILSPDEIIIQQLKENKSWVESNGSGGKTTTTTTQKVISQAPADSPAAHLERMRAMVENGQG